MIVVGFIPADAAQKIRELADVSLLDLMKIKGGQGCRDNNGRLNTSAASSSYYAWL